MIDKIIVSRVEYFRIRNFPVTMKEEFVQQSLDFQDEVDKSQLFEVIQSASIVVP